MSFAQKRTYPTSITLNNGNTTYCQNATSTQLTITLGTFQCGSTGSNSNVTHTERIFVNTSNSTVGGTEVVSLSNALFATNATYTPPTTNIGILYYYSTVEWSVNGCAPSGTITSSVVSIEVFGPNSSIPLSQGFNGASCGWTTQQVSGTAGAITNISSGTNETTSPFEGAGFVQFNSYNCASGSSTRLLSPLLNVNINEDVEIKFHWRNSTTSTYSDRLDRVVVQWFNGTTWIDIQTYNRPDPILNGWQEKTCQFNTGNNTSIRIGFRFISAFGFNCALDNIRLEYITPIPLPVTLTSFTTDCNNGIPLLKWTTESEQNSDYFQIERSRDGFEWVEVSKIQGMGNSSSNKDYQFIDMTSGGYFEGYYRLKQVDFDGKFEYFGPKSMFCKSYTNELTSEVFPNPTNNEVSLGIRNNIYEMITVLVMDYTGRILQEMIIEVDEGYTLRTIDLSKYITGTYLVCIITNNSKYIHKVMRK